MTGEVTPNADMTMNELFARFMHTKENRLAPATLQRYDGLLRLYLRPVFGTKRVAAVKAVNILCSLRSMVETFGQRAHRPARGRPSPQHPPASREVGDYPAQSGSVA